MQRSERAPLPMPPRFPFPCRQSRRPSPVPCYLSTCGCKTPHRGVAAPTQTTIRMDWLARSQSMRMCHIRASLFRARVVHCDAADRGSCVRCHAPATCGHPAREKCVRGSLLLRCEGKDPLRRRHTEGQQQSKDREIARVRGGWGAHRTRRSSISQPTKRMSKNSRAFRRRTARTLEFQVAHDVLVGRPKSRTQ